jgi:quercetin dioxygenase-like cupin family protein
VRRVELPDEALTAFDSKGVRVRPLARALQPVDGFAVDVITVAAGGRLGRHPTRLWQLLAVVSGEGWVSGGDGRRQHLRAGEAVVWEPGEQHESGSDGGMVLCVVQSPDDPVPRRG